MSRNRSTHNNPPQPVPLSLVPCSVVTVGARDPYLSDRATEVERHANIILNVDISQLRCFTIHLFFPSLSLSLWNTYIYVYIYIIAEKNFPSIFGEEKEI